MVRRRSSEEAAKLTIEVQALVASVPVELRWAWQHAVESTSFALSAFGEFVQTGDTFQSTSTNAPSGKAKGKARADDCRSKAKSARLSLDQDEDEGTHLVGPTQKISAAELRSRVLSCELALMAQLLIARIHSPFTSNLNAAGFEPLSPCIAALLDACKAMIRVAKLIQLPEQLRMPPSPHVAPSALLAMYPLDQLVFDTVVLCSLHCYGGKMIASKDGGVESQETDFGKAELVHTLGVGLGLLEARYGTSNDAGQASGPSNASDYSKSPLSVKAKIVAFLRNQWSLQRLSFASRKRKLIEMEGQGVDALVSPEQEMPREGTGPSSSTEKTGVPPRAAADDQSIRSFPNQPAQAQASKPTSIAPSKANAASAPVIPRLTQQEVAALHEKKRGGTASSRDKNQFTARARKSNTGGGAGKRKHDKSQTPSQSLMTTAARVFKDGKLEYEDEEQALVSCSLIMYASRD